MIALFSFRLFLVSLVLTLGVAPRAGKDWLSFAFMIGLCVALLTVSLRQAAGRRRRQDRSVKTAGEMMWRRLTRNKNAMAGMFVLIVLAYAAILAPFLVPCDPLETDWGALSQGMSWAHWLGTDDMGRDIFSRNLFGIRVALGIGMTAVVLNTIVGTALGLAAGFYGGRTDGVIMRLLEIWNAVPFILLAIAVMSALGTGITKLILIISLSHLMSFARIIRSSVLLVRESDYIAAARVIGIPDLHIIIRHVIPNTISPILVMASLTIGETILIIAGLSFLGLGIQPPMPSLGGMLSNGQQFLHENLLMSFVPGITILLIVLSFNLFGDGVRDALDTRLND